MSVTNQAASHPQIERLCRRYSALCECRSSIEAAFACLVSTFENGGKLLVCGNGGSAADGEHIVGELMKKFVLPRPIPQGHLDRLSTLAGAEGEQIARLLERGLPAIALTSHSALTTATLNDANGEMIFAQQVYSLAKPSDVLLGISTSGNSQNVINAFHVARLLEMNTIALTGRSGGRLSPLANIAIDVPADRVDEIQELHLPVYHALCRALEEYFFGVLQ